MMTDGFKITPEERIGLTDHVERVREAGVLEYPEDSDDSPSIAGDSSWTAVESRRDGYNHPPVDLEMLAILGLALAKGKRAPPKTIT